MSDLPENRAEAKIVGSQFYNTGKPCKNGHSANRRTLDSHCIVCDTERAASEKYKQRGRANSKKTHMENREQILPLMRERNKSYYQKNKEKIKESALRYQRENSEARNAYKTMWAKEKASRDPVFKMSLVARRMLHRALGVAGQVKYKRTFDHLGYTSEDLVRHLESQFTEGMTWENYGEWHIDHIKSLKSLTEQGVKDPKILNALENLQPLWARDNLIKGAN